jgi:hypothetical protein
MGLEEEENLFSQLFQGHERQIACNPKMNPGTFHH